MNERAVLILALRALMRRDIPPARLCSDSEFDFDTEAVLVAARALGVDVDSEKARAYDRFAYCAAEFDAKWGGR